MILGNIGIEDNNRPIYNNSYLIDENTISIIDRSNAEFLLPANKVLMNKINSASNIRMSQFYNGSHQSGRYIQLSFPQYSCSPADTYKGDKPYSSGLAGQLRPTGGMNFPTKIAACNSAKIVYYIRFPSGFDFRLGGKLPGLSSFNITASGGNQGTSGNTSFTARLMWQQGGNITPYCYTAENLTRWGTNYGTGFGKSLPISTNTWYKIDQTIKLNDLGKSNGECVITINDVLLCDIHDIIWRNNQTLKIEGVFMSSFFGGHTGVDGSDDTYETMVNTTIDFSDIEFYVLD